MSLFGNPAEKKTGTLFGSTAAPPGGLFGQSQSQPTQQQNTGNLFGASQPANTGANTGGGLFTPQPTNTNTGGSSLFGGTQQQQQPGGLFGQSQQQPQQQQQSTGGLFGQSQQQQQQQQPNPSNSLFGGRLQPAPSLSAAQAQQLQQSQQGLPQLRQSTKDSWASGSLSGHSMLVPNMILNMH